MSVCVVCCCCVGCISVCIMCCLMSVVVEVYVHGMYELCLAKSCLCDVAFGL